MAFVEFVLAIVLMAAVITMMVGNALIVLSPLVNTRLRRVISVFIGSLASADLQMAVFVIPGRGIAELLRYWPFGAVLCKMSLVGELTFRTASILHVFYISIDRFVSITQLWGYSRRITRFHAYIICALLWMLATIVGSVPLALGWNTVNGTVQLFENITRCQMENGNVGFRAIHSVLLYYIPAFLMITTYVRLAVTLSEQARMIGGRAARARILLMEYQATRSMQIVTACIISCWFPYYIMFTFTHFAQAPHNELRYTITTWIGYANSLMNPFIFAFLDVEFRSAFVKLLRGRLWAECREAGNEPMIPAAELQAYSTDSSMNVNAEESGRI